MFLFAPYIFLALAFPNSYIPERGSMSYFYGSHHFSFFTKYVAKSLRFWMLRQFYEAILGKLTWTQNGGVWTPPMVAGLTGDVFLKTNSAPDYGLLINLLRECGTPELHPWLLCRLCTRSRF